MEVSLHFHRFSLYGVLVEQLYGFNNSVVPEILRRDRPLLTSQASFIGFNLRLPSCVTELTEEAPSFARSHLAILNCSSFSEPHINSVPLLVTAGEIFGNFTEHTCINV